VTERRNNDNDVTVARPAAVRVALAGTDESQSAEVGAEAHIREREKRLGGSDERFRTMADAAPVMIWIAGVDRLRTYFNRGWLEFTGRTLEQESGNGWAQGIHPEDFDRCLATYTSSFDRHEDFSMQYRLRCRDGVYSWVWDKGAPHFAPDGQFQGYIGTCIDVTERQELEREAAERSGQLTAILEGVVDGLVVHDCEGRVVQMNGVARDLFAAGVPPDYPMRPIAERAAMGSQRDEHNRPLGPEEMPSYRILRGETLVGKKTVDLTVHLLNGDKVSYNVGGAPIRDERGEITGAVTIYRDVTERRRLEQRTHEALAALLTMAEALVCGSDPDLDTAEVGAEGERHQTTDMPAVALRLAELIRTTLGCERVSLHTIAPRTWAIQTLAVVGLTPQQQAHLRLAIDGLRLDASLDAAALERLCAGETLLVDLTTPPRSYTFGGHRALVAPLRRGTDLLGILALDYGQTPHAYGPQELALAGAVAHLATLVIERDQLLREREAAQAVALALEETNRRLDDFMGIASHELRTPLTAFKANLQLALRQARRLEAEGLVAHDGSSGQVERLAALRALLVRAAGAAERQQRLVDDLLDVARIRGGALRMSLEMIDLAAVVRQTVEEQRLSNPGRTITLALLEGPLIVLADAERIAQVVANYLSNALKFTLEDQVVAVQVDLPSNLDEGAAGASHVYHEPMPSGGHMAWVRVSVRDEGPGIPAADQLRIWERFQRVEAIGHRSGSGLGLGLGLYISRTMITEHKGAVGVESTPGAGSTFWFALPLAPSKESTVTGGTRSPA